MSVPERVPEVHINFVKRAYRIASATHLSEASRLQLAETAWAVRSRVRASVVDYLFATKTAEQLRKQEHLQATYADLLDRRFRAGEIPLPDVTTARIDLTKLRQTLRIAEGQVSTTHATLAAAIGIPESGLAEKTVNLQGLDVPPDPGSLSSQRTREAAVLNRLDVRRALEQYHGPIQSSA